LKDALVAFFNLAEQQRAPREVWAACRGSASFFSGAARPRLATPSQADLIGFGERQFGGAQRPC